MVVGGIRTGKSTMINAIINHIMGVDWEDDWRFSIIDIIVEEMENKNDESNSQTEWITCYTIFPQEGTKHDYTLNIIDTPGFGDTRGIDRDRAIVDHLRYLFNSSGEQRIESLNAVWFVAKASDAQLTPSQKNIFDSILSIFGKDIEKNIFIIVTFADNKQLSVMHALKTAQVPCENVYIFNNLPQCVDQEDSLAKVCGPEYWKMVKQSFNQLFDKLMKTDQRSLKLTAEVLNTRKQLQVTIKGTQYQIQAGLHKMDTIRQKKIILKNHEANLSDNTNFEYEVTEIHQKKIDFEKGTYVTNCLDCNMTCHYPCGIPKDEDLRVCSAMRDGKCTVCQTKRPEKCDWNRHVRNSYRFECFPLKVKKTFDDLKDKLGTEVKEHRDIVKNLNVEFDGIQGDVSSSIEYVQECVNRLKQIALKEDPLSSIEYIKILIERETNEGTPGYLERIKMLQAIKEQAELLQAILDTNFNPWRNFTNDS